MDEQYAQLRKIFTSIQTPSPSDSLVADVMRRIQSFRQRRQYVADIVAGTLVVLSVFLFIPAVVNMVHAFMSSGFLESASLILSDTAVLGGIWQSFVMMLLETLPVAGVVSFLVATLFLLGSLRMFFGGFPHRTVFRFPY